MSHRVARYALVPTHNRPVELRRLVISLVNQCDAVVIIDNASDPLVDLDADDELARCPLPLHVIRDDEQPPNLSRLWNVGLDYIFRQLRGGDPSDPWDVAVLNDDTELPLGWFDYVATGL